jgi:hypothetical protein
MRYDRTRPYEAIKKTTQDNTIKPNATTTSDDKPKSFVEKVRKREITDKRLPFRVI